MIRSSWTLNAATCLAGTEAPTARKPVKRRTERSTGTGDSTIRNSPGFDPIASAVDERDRILAAMDVNAAKTFIAKHGGFTSSRPLDWTRVLHLARFEVTTMPDELRLESQLYLAQTGAQSLTTLPQNSPYLRMAMDLLFPHVVTEEWIEMELGND